MMQSWIGVILLLTSSYAQLVPCPCDGGAGPCLVGGRLWWGSNTGAQSISLTLQSSWSGEGPFPDSFGATCTGTIGGTADQELDIELAVTGITLVSTPLGDLTLVRAENAVIPDVPATDTELTCQVCSVNPRNPDFRHPHDNSGACDNSGYCLQVEVTLPVNNEGTFPCDEADDFANSGFFLVGQCGVNNACGCVNDNDVTTIDFTTAFSLFDSGLDPNPPVQGGSSPDTSITDVLPGPGNQPASAVLCYNWDLTDRDGAAGQTYGNNFFATSQDAIDPFPRGQMNVDMTVFIPDTPPSCTVTGPGGSVPIGESATLDIDVTDIDADFDGASDTVTVIGDDLIGLPDTQETPFSTTAEFVCVVEGDNTVTIGVVDSCGISSSCETTVTCQEDIVILPGSIGDLVWNDLNGNGIQDFGEPGIPGVSVRLLSDENGNGLIDIGDIELQIQFTDANGNYLFPDLSAGAYLVEATRPNGFVETTNNPQAVVLQQGEDNLTADFGFQAVPLCDISGSVFTDDDQNGIKLPNEQGIAGVSVQCANDLNNNGMCDPAELVHQTVVTDGLGNYAFTGLQDGNYAICVDTTSLPLANLSPTIPNPPEASVTCAGTDVPNVNFGFAGQGSIGDLVFFDTNQDGIRDPGEPGFPGVTIVLKQNGIVVQLGMTDGNGNYLFGNLPAGTYQVEVTDDDEVLKDLVLTTPPPIRTVVLGAGENDLNQDFGYFFGPGDNLDISDGTTVDNPFNFEGIDLGLGGCIPFTFDATKTLDCNMNFTADGVGLTDVDILCITTFTITIVVVEDDFDGLDISNEHIAGSSGNVAKMMKLLSSGGPSNVGGRANALPNASQGSDLGRQDNNSPAPPPPKTRAPLDLPSSVSLDGSCNLSYRIVRSIGGVDVAGLEGQIFLQFNVEECPIISTSIENGLVTLIAECTVPLGTNEVCPTIDNLQIIVGDELSDRAANDLDRSEAGDVALLQIMGADNSPPPPPSPESKKTVDPDTETEGGNTQTLRPIQMDLNCVDGGAVGDLPIIDSGLATTNTSATVSVTGEETCDDDGGKKDFSPVSKSPFPQPPSPEAKGGTFGQSLDAQKMFF